MTTSLLCRSLILVSIFSLNSLSYAESHDQEHPTDPHPRSAPTFFQDGVRAQAFTDIAAQQGISKIITRLSFGWVLWNSENIEISGGLDASVSLKGKDLTSFGPTIDVLYSVLPKLKIGLWGAQANGYFPRDTVLEQQNKYIDVSSQTVGLRFLYQHYKKSAVYIGFGQRIAIRMLAPTDDDAALKNKVGSATSTLMLGFRFST
ncbi:MAG: hypothetical protein AB8C84_04270 [Oligoflexales bacterium]